ncbi:MAG: FGGY family carbohydrate kinase [Cyanobacteria bacterium J06560_6]
MRYVIGVDIGTSSTKAVLFDTNGHQVGRCSQGYELRSPEPGAAEQNPDDILQAATQTTAKVVVESGIDPQRLVGISFSAAMHTVLLVDGDDQPITPMYTWADNRSDRWAVGVRSQDPDLYKRTSLPAHPMSPVVKMAWLKDEQPEAVACAARVVSIKEYVLWHWCGEWVVDLSIASTTGFLNLVQRNWDEGALKVAGICREQLSELVPTMHKLSLREQVAKAMEVSADVPVIVGASDGVLSNLGVGAIAPKTAAITLGTSGAVRQIVSEPKTAEEAQLFCYALTDDQWVMGGAVNNGGIALQWTRDSLVPYSVPPDERWHGHSLGVSPVTVEPSASTYERLTAMAEQVPPGADGLIFHPHLLGERAPLWDAQARGNFFGFGRHHTQDHLVRAVMEGVLYNMASVFGALETAGGEVETLSASGGFAHSALWQQMLADVFEREVVIPTVIESSALGAAVLALVAVGEWSGMEQVADCIEIEHTRQPIAENVKRYQKLLPIYNNLLAGFSEQYEALQQAMK